MSNLIKILYYALFWIFKRIKYPSAKIYTNFVMPGVVLGKGVVLREKVKVQRGVTIGDYTFVNEYTQIDSNTKSIGKFCSISHNVKIGLGPHPHNFVSTSPVFYSSGRGYIEDDLYDEFEDKGYTTIGHDVLIYANVIIVAGISVGNGAVIGGGSIVTHDVPPYAIVAGVPAKIIGYRFSPEVIQKLNTSNWWDLDLKYLVKLSSKMKKPESFLSEVEKCQ